MNWDTLKAVGRKASVVVAAFMILSAAVVGAGLLTTGDPMEYAPVEEGEAFGISVGSVAVGMAVGGAIYAYLDGPDVNADKLAKQDALEAKTSIYQAVNQMGANQEVIGTAYGNYLTDTKAVALMVGRNAYIRAIDNGNVSDVVDARLAAKEAVENYYAKKQQNLKAAWETQSSSLETYINRTRNNSIISDTYVNLSVGAPKSFYSNYQVDSYNLTLVEDEIALLNGSVVNVTDIKVEARGTADNNGERSWYVNESLADHTLEITNVSMRWSETDYNTYPDRHFYVKNFTVQPPTESYDTTKVFDTRDFERKWTKIAQQNQAVQDEITDIVNGTYSEIQAGEIDTSDLVDPYLGMRNYDPTDDGETFSIRALSAMGVTPPENTSDMGEMCVVVNGTERCGILMSDGQPTVSTIDRTGDTSGFYTGLAVDPVDGENQTGNVTMRLIDTDGAIDNKTITLPYDSDLNQTATNPTVYETLDSGVDRVEMSFTPENGNGVPEVRAIGEDGSNKTLVQADLLAEPSTKEGFRIGGTYNPSEVPGPQFIVTDGGQQYELTDPFALQNASLDGVTYGDGDRVSYPDPDYDTATVDGYKQLSHQLQGLQAQINAMQEQTRNPGGGGAIFGGFSLFGFSGLKGLLVLMFLAAAALALLSRV